MSTDKLTAETISFEQIRQLRGEAIAAFDADQAAICDLALEGEIDMDDYTTVSDRMSRRLRTMNQTEAQLLCADTINAARARAQDDSEVRS